MTFQIHEETDADHGAIFAVHQAAFGGDGEAKLVDALRAAAVPVISLVAFGQGEVVGHICFSPMTFSMEQPKLIMGLAPVGVLPGRQRRGIGSALVTAGLDECRKLGVEAVFVLGHAEYYPKFGFVPASRFGIGTEYDVPDDHFMGIELVSGALAGIAGKVKYHSAFAELG
jgi:putative acetyltransferase